LPIFVVGVGCTGTYLWLADVDAGIAGAPGRAIGYEVVEDGMAVVVAMFVLGPYCVAWVGAGAVVCGVTASALAALIGLWV
jgi:hypothetical protein